MKKLNRGWVKNAAIIFLAVMLFLAFFSNTVLNRSLPEVEVRQPESGAITNALRGSANVESLGSYSVEVESEQLILAVYVREGDEVTQGEALFRLEEGENALLKELNETRLLYESMLLDMTEPDHAALNETVRQAREDLQRAEAERGDLGAAEIGETAAQRRVDEARANETTQSNRLTQLELELSYIDDWDSRSSYISQQVLAYERALANFVQNVGMTYDAWTEANPNASNAWSQAVASTRAALQSAAATQRVAVMQAIHTQAGLVTAAQNTLTAAENTLARIQRIVAADAAVREAQRALNSAQITLSSQQQQDDIATAQQRLELNALAEKIADLEARIERQNIDIGENGEVTITARYDGVIVGLTAVAGQTTEPGIALARIEVAQVGHVAELSNIDARQATEIRPGMPVEVGSFNWFANLTGQVSSVRPDPESPSDRRIVAIEITGDVFTGEQVNISIPLSSAPYEVIVPRSAVAQDAEGHHVYVLESRESPLGTRYTVRRVDVSVEAEDERNIAIRGDVDRWSNVIVRSSGPLSDRDAVRLAS